MTRILNCEDAMDSKEKARDINNFDRKSWNEVAEELCYEGVKQRFLQNQYLLDELLQTGNKTLVESSYVMCGEQEYPYQIEIALSRNSGNPLEF